MQSFVARALALLLLLSHPALAGNWPQWRGPNGDGVSPETGLPVKWSEAAGVAWKCRLFGEGASAPTVWGGAVFVTYQNAEEMLLLKIAADLGNIEWARTIGFGAPGRMKLAPKKGDDRRHQKFHNLHNMASPCPATDGKTVFVHFGNGDLAAVDFDGKLLWKRNLQKDHGEYSIWWGHANSPVLFGDFVISVCMQDSLSDLEGDKPESYVAAHDKRTGELKWRTLRPTIAKAEQCDSYTTPLFRTAAGKTEMIIMGGNQLDAYDPATGKQLWFLPGLTGNRTITGPTLGKDLIYATVGMRGALHAVKPGGSGQLKADSVAWKVTQGTPDSPCPVVFNNLLFVISDNGIAQCFDAATGELKWKERLPGDYKASPVAGDGKVYFLNLAGKCTVIAAAAKFEKLAENQIDDETIASPAIADGKIYLRGKKALYCISGEK